MTPTPLGKGQLGNFEIGSLSHCSGSISKFPNCTFDLHLRQISFMASSIADIRKNYSQKTLLETDVASDPVTQFKSWWEEAIASKIDEVNAMTLATSSRGWCTRQQGSYY